MVGFCKWLMDLVEQVHIGDRARSSSGQWRASWLENIWRTDITGKELVLFGLKGDRVAHGQRMD